MLSKFILSALILVTSLFVLRPSQIVSAQFGVPPVCVASDTTLTIDCSCTSVTTGHNLSVTNGSNEPSFDGACGKKYFQDETTTCTDPVTSDSCDFTHQIKLDCTVALCNSAPNDTDHDGHGPTCCGGDDCDDTKATVYPGAPEVCDDNIPNDCNHRDEDHTDCNVSSCCGSDHCANQPPCCTYGDPNQQCLTDDGYSPDTCDFGTANHGCDVGDYYSNWDDHCCYSTPLLQYLSMLMETDSH